MEIIWFVTELFQLPAVILGVIALAGLLLLRKPASEVVTGTFKTVLGMLIIGVGIGAIIGALEPIQAMFEAGIPIGPEGAGVETFVTFDEGVVGAVQDANVGGVGGMIGLTLLFGFLFHLVLARITPFRYVYLTGHMIWVHAGGFAILFASFDIPNWLAVAAASLVTGAYFTLAPAMAQPVMRRITGNDDIAFGHGQTLLNMLGAGVGRLVGNPERSSEEIQVKEGWNFFRDIAISTSLVMLVVAGAAAILAVLQIGIGTFQEEISGGQNWLVFGLLQGIEFVAGMLVLLYGVRMLISEIVPAFQGIAERIIPGARPALDVPVIFSFAPNALLIGLIVGVIAQIIAMFLLALIGWPVPLPSMIVAFFASGAGAIFANATGGRRGAVAGGFLWGFVGWFMISFAYRFEVFGNLEEMGAAGLAFTVPDVIVPGIVIWLFAQLFGVA